MSKLLRIENHSGTPIPYSGGKLILFNQAVIFRVPGMSGGLIWNRPVSVLNIPTDGPEQVIQVRDITRQFIWTMFGITLVLWLLLVMFGRKNRPDQRGQS